MLQPLEKWSLNNRELTVIPQQFTTVEEQALFSKLPNRPQFSYTAQSVTAPVVFASLVGVKGDIEEYQALLFDLDEKLQNFDKLYIKLEHHLSKQFVPQKLQEMQKVWHPFERDDKTPTATLVEAMIDADVVKVGADQNIKALVLNALTKTIEYYRMRPDSRYNEVKNMIFYLVHWYTRYVADIIVNFDFSRNNPKCLYWGEIGKREVYFMLLLHYLGVDVLYINGIDDQLLELIDPQRTYISRLEFSRKIDLGEFPTTRPKLVYDTVAKSASEEITDIIHSEDSGNYKPWQLINYHVRSVPLRTTMDEVVINFPEKAMFRQGWQAQGGRVTVPHLFAKISGMHSKENEYWKLYNTLITTPMTWSKERLPMVKPMKSKWLHQEFHQVITKERTVDPEKLITMPFWPYRACRQHLQKLIAEIVADLCASNHFKRLPNIAPEAQRIELFSYLMRLPDFVLEMLQKFDYPFEVPKLVIFNSGKNENFSQGDAIIVAFLAQVGADVIHFNPTGKNDVEIYINEDIIDCHFLENMVYNSKPKKRPFFGKYF